MGAHFYDFFFLFDGVSDSLCLYILQKGNPLLKHIRNVRWAFADIVCDYLLGQSSCALYLRYCSDCSSVYTCLLVVFFVIFMIWILEIGVNNVLGSCGHKLVFCYLSEELLQSASIA